MKYPAILAVLCTLIGGSLATNAWQYHRITIKNAALDASYKTLDMVEERMNESTKQTQEFAAKTTAVLAEGKSALDRVGEENARKAELIAALEKENAALRQMYEASKETPRAGIKPPVTQRTSSSSATPPTHEQVQLPSARIHEVVRKRATEYYKTVRRNGSGSTLVFDLDFDLADPREVPGWTGRYEVEGRCWYQFYDSIWGGSFSGARGTFSAAVEVRGGAIKLVDFSPK